MDIAPAAKRITMNKPYSIKNPMFATNMGITIALLLALISAIWLGSSLFNFRENATVIRVVDGDTIDILLNGEIERVRYIGVNAPEWDTEAGKISTQINRYITGDSISIQRDKSDRDKYGRLLRYVWNSDNQFVNCELLEAGAAEIAVYPPDTTRIPELRGCMP